MTPNPYVYLDYYQEEPEIAKVYENPVFHVLLQTNSFPDYPMYKT